MVIIINNIYGSNNTNSNNPPHVRHQDPIGVPPAVWKIRAKWSRESLYPTIPRHYESRKPVQTPNQSIASTKSPDYTMKHGNYMQEQDSLKPYKQ